MLHYKYRQHSQKTLLIEYVRQLLLCAVHYNYVVLCRGLHEICSTASSFDLTYVLVHYCFVYSIYVTMTTTVMQPSTKIVKCCIYIYCSPKVKDQKYCSNIQPCN